MVPGERTYRRILWPIMSVSRQTTYLYVTFQKINNYLYITMHYPVLLSWRAWVVRDHGIKCVHNYTSPKPEKSVPVPTLISSVLPVLAAGYPAVRQYAWRQFEEIEWSESHVWPHSGCWRWQGNYDDSKRPYDANFTYNIILGLYSLCPASYKVLKMRTCQTITYVIIITGVSFRSRVYIRCCC